MTSIWSGPPLRVFKYVRWCTICRVCRRAVAIDSPSQQRAMNNGFKHTLSEEHLKRLEVTSG